MIPFVWSMPTLLVALFVLAVGMGFNSPSLSSMVSKLSDADDQGGMLGLASSLASLGRVVGPGVGRLPLRRVRHDDTVRERGGPDVPFACCRSAFVSGCTGRDSEADAAARRPIRVR